MLHFQSSLQPMPQRAQYSTTSAAAVRAYLGITQDELAAYLGVSRSQVAHAEAGRRQLATGPRTRLLRLFLVVPQPWGAGPPETPVIDARLLRPAGPLPVAAPAGASEPLADSKLVRRRWRRCEYLAMRLRRALADRHAHRTTYLRRARVLTVLADPAAALPDDNPARTERWGAWLAADSARRLGMGGPADPITLALAEVKLYRLEAEAATLAQWLQPGG
ncbi:MAG: helix-turn-helix domain-containing protein [Hymenobacteraceae bacterium]|nr:helix-turn-helix domain-containing protein [Hymenobacteraceae bacterium]